MPLRAYGLNCTLKSGDESSSTQKLLDQLLRALGKHDVETASDRVANFNVKPGVTADEGDGDEWPQLRKRIMEADILVVATPIWMGQPSSVCKRVLERLDAVLSEIDDDGRYPTFGKVAVAAVVGNEDGAHHCCAEIYQALTDVGFTIPGASPPYWVGEAMGSTDYQDLERTPKKVAETIRTIASNAAHLAQLLKDSPYPKPRPLAGRPVGRRRPGPGRTVMSGTDENPRLAAATMRAPPMEQRPWPSASPGSHPSPSVPCSAWTTRRSRAMARSATASMPSSVSPTASNCATPRRAKPCCW